MIYTIPGATIWNVQFGSSAREIPLSEVRISVPNKYSIAYGLARVHLFVIMPTGEPVVFRERESGV